MLNSLGGGFGNGVVPENLTKATSRIDEASQKGVTTGYANYMLVLRIDTRHELVSP